MGEGTPGRRASAISCGLHRLAEALGDRAHDRVDYAQPEDEPGLRVLVRDEGGSDLLGDDPTDAQKARQCRLMRASQTPSQVKWFQPDKPSTCSSLRSKTTSDWVISPISVRGTSTLFASASRTGPGAQISSS